MSLGTILLIALIILFVLALPRWSHNARWGYYPSGGLGVILRAGVDGDRANLVTL